MSYYFVLWLNFKKNVHPHHAWAFADKLIKDATDGRCYCVSAECMEHGANSAIYTPDSANDTTE